MIRKVFITVILAAGWSVFLSAQQTERIWEHHPLPTGFTTNNTDITGIAFDRTGAMWISVSSINDMAGGLKYVEADSSWTIFAPDSHHHPDPSDPPDEEDDENSIACDRSLTVAVDYLDRVWFGALGHGVSRLTDTTWKHFTTISGLPHNTVQKIITDRDTAWIATRGGLSKFVNDTCVVSYKSELAGTDVTCLVMDLSGNLWVGTYQGISVFKGAAWTDYRPIQSSSLADNLTEALAVDAQGNIWAAIYNSGIYKFDGTKWNLQFEKKSVKFTSLAFDKKGNLWVGSDKGVWEFNGTRWENHIEKRLYNDQVGDIAIDKDDAVWIACKGGLTKVYEKTTSLHVSDIKEDNPITIYPNPIKDQFTVTNVSDATITLYSILGQEIGTYYSTDNDITVDTTPFEQGIYIVKIEKNHKTSSLKVSVIR